MLDISGTAAGGERGQNSPGSSQGLGGNTGREKSGRARWKSVVCTHGPVAARLGQMCNKAEGSEGVAAAASWVQTKYTCSPHTCCQPSRCGSSRVNHELVAGGKDPAPAPQSCWGLSLPVKG